MTGAADRPAASAEPLIVLAGGGRFPVLVAEAARAAGRPVTIAGIRGEADPAIEAFDHQWIGRGHVSRLMRLARRRGARELVVVGGMRERRMPHLSEIDLADLVVVARHWRLLTHGEDGILRRIARLFETRGLRVVGAGEVAPQLLMPQGPLGAIAPNDAARAAIAFGVAEARAHGRGDLGQGVIVTGTTVAAKEGAEGTDAMLAVFAARSDRPAGPAILVKCPKPMQDLRLDLPAIGPDTVRSAVAAGLSGVAVVAGATLVADRADLVRAADAAGIFVYGVAPAGSAVDGGGAA